jgi:hypothetical protein
MINQEIIDKYLKEFHETQGLTIPIEFHSYLHRMIDEVIKFNKLSIFVSNDEDKHSNLQQAYELLLKQAEINDSVEADEVVTMWYIFENHFTVRRLLNEIQ